MDSLDNNIQELVPIGRFESRQTHSKSFNFLDNFVLDLEFIGLLVLLVIQLNFEYEFFNQVVVIEG